MTIERETIGANGRSKDIDMVLIELPRRISHVRSVEILLQEGRRYSLLYADGRYAQAGL